MRCDLNETVISLWVEAWIILLWKIIWFDVWVQNLVGMCVHYYGWIRYVPNYILKNLCSINWISFREIYPQLNSSFLALAHFWRSQSISILGKSGDWFSKKCWKLETDSTNGIQFFPLFMTLYNICSFLLHKP